VVSVIAKIAELDAPKLRDDVIPDYVAIEPERPPGHLVADPAAPLAFKQPSIGRLGKRDGRPLRDVRAHLNVMLDYPLALVSRLLAATLLASPLLVLVGVGNLP
jgi:hypothetical protein